MDKNWVIAGHPTDAQPIVGTIYEIRDARKGTFTGRVSYRSVGNGPKWNDWQAIFTIDQSKIV